MSEMYNVYLAVDFSNCHILFVGHSSGELRQKILSNLDSNRLPIQGAIRLYCTTEKSYRKIKNLMVTEHYHFHQAAILR